MKTTTMEKRTQKSRMYSVARCCDVSLLALVFVGRHDAMFALVSTLVQRKKTVLHILHIQVRTSATITHYTFLHNTYTQPHFDMSSQTHTYTTLRTRNYLSFSLARRPIPLSSGTFPIHCAAVLSREASVLVCCSWSRLPTC